MFRSSITLLIFSFFWFVCSADETYTTKFDNIDLQDVVKNERLLKNYIDCLLEKGRCTPDGQELKKNLPDALQTECSKCSEKQKNGSDFIMNYLIENKPEYYHELEVKYDPEGNYRKNYLESQAKEVTEPVKA